MLTPDQINTFHALGRDAYDMASPGFTPWLT